jgi:broad specificity phosphatase PhoE
MRKKTLLLLGASGVMALGIAAPMAAAAADSPKPRQQQFASALAKELGVDEAKVTAALENLRTERSSERTEAKGDRKKGQRQDLKTRLDAAVKEGKLTQAEADAVLKAVEAGILWDGGWQHGRWNGEKHGNWNNK